MLLSSPSGTVFGYYISPDNTKGKQFPAEKTIMYYYCPMVVHRSV